MDKYKFIKRLGYTTWLVEDKIGQKLALKQVECIDEIEANKIFNEMASLQSLKHPLIIPYHHLFVSWDKERAVHLCIVTRYISHGNLKDFLISCRASKQLVNETLLKKWIGQLTEGLARLHFYHYNHRRLKTSNIYINKDNSLCIGDIGTSLKSSISLNVMNWLSPEAVESTEYDERFDMWSLGCVILELVTTSFLTDSEFIATLYQLKINTDILAKILQKVSQIYDNDIAHLIQSLIRTNYHQRPLAIEVCDTPFILDCMSLYESSLLQELKNPVDEQDSFIIKMMKCKYAIDSQVAILEDFIRLIQDNNQTDKFILKQPCKELLYHTVQVNLTYPELVSKCFLMIYMGSGTNNVSTFMSDKLLTGLSITAIKIHSNDISVITEATKVLLALSTKGSQIRMVLVNERIVHTSIEVIRRFPQQPNILTLNFILLLNILCEQSIILQTAVSEGLVSVVCLALRDHQHSSLVVGPALSLLWASSSSGKRSNN
jgi:serine/threonine protein kinase